MILDQLGEETRARRNLEEAFGGAQMAGLVESRDLAASQLVRSYLRRGNVNMAENYVPERFESRGVDLPSTEPVRFGARAEIRAARAEDDQAEALFGQAIAGFDSLGHGYHRAKTRRAYARFLISRDRPSEAREHVEWLLRYYAEPIAERQRLVAEDLMRQIEAALA